MQKSIKTSLPENWGVTGREKRANFISEQGKKTGTPYRESKRMRGEMSSKITHSEFQRNLFIIATSTKIDLLEILRDKGPETALRNAIKDEKKFLQAHLDDTPETINVNIAELRNEL
jgi:hypothetical protein